MRPYVSNMRNFPLKSVSPHSEEDPMAEVSRDPHAQEQLMAAWRANPLAKPSDVWPRLFWTQEEAAELRDRARRVPGFVEGARKAADAVIRDPKVFAAEPAWHHSQQHPILVLATAAWLTEEERLVSLATRLMDRAASAEGWVAPVHKPMRCDHVAANVGATLARAMDLLAGRLTDDHVRRYREAVREKCLDPFLAASRGRSEWWAKRECVSNWRIMTCGDAGLAALGTCGDEDDLEELLAYATEGVVDILNTIPEDGDFVEGPHYFVATLGMGLRYLVALGRLWPDAPKYLNHPRLQRVGDYLLHVTEPDGAAFNYFDNGLGWGADERATMLLLAREQRRGDLAQLARRGEVSTIPQLAWDDPELPSALPTGRTTAHFRRTGLATCRSEWSETATYAGFRCGPNTCGHSHLDCGSFVISSGRTRMVVDEGTWSYAHFLGFFDREQRRWEFDANATVGHNTLLIDGKGQIHDEQAPGRVVHYSTAELGTVAVGDMTAPYGPLASECVRWFVFLPPATVLIYDRVRSSAMRHVEWLLHHRGEITGDDAVWTLRTGDARLTVHRLLRRDDDPWRVSDVVRRTYYRESNRGTPQEPEVRYRSWGPIQAKTEHDLLMVLSVGDAPQPPEAKVSASAVEVRVAERRVMIFPQERRAEILAG